MCAGVQPRHNAAVDRELTTAVGEAQLSRHQVCLARLVCNAVAQTAFGRTPTLYLHAASDARKGSAVGCDAKKAVLDC